MFNKYILKLTLICVLSVYMICSHATQITIVNLDSENEGFSDTTAATPVGGNVGTTIGAQRLIVFEYAAGVWESIINSNVEIKIDAKFDPLTCSSSSAILGSAGPIGVFKNFKNAPISQTFYPTALANSLANKRLAAPSDIRATFNSNIDNNNNCLNNTNWYYGLDGNAPANSMDLLFVVMHEIAHGLGFLTFVDMSTGQKFAGLNDAFMLHLETHGVGSWGSINDNQRLNSITSINNLHWTGPSVITQINNYSSGVNQGHIRNYAPAVVSSGSSVSHFDSALSPNELMEPFISSDPKGPGLAIQLMQDIGWNVFSSFSPVMGDLENVNMSGSLAQIGFVIRDEDSALNSLQISFTSSNTSLIDSTGLAVSGISNLRTLSISPNAGVTGMALITVNVSDGVNLVSKDFTLSVINTAPVIGINYPLGNSNFILSDIIAFEAVVTDVEDGNTLSDVQWISSIDGFLGTGLLLNTTLTAGAHNIVASITDSGGITSDTNITVNMYGDADLDGMNDLWELNSFSTLDRDGLGDFDGDGISDLDEYLVTIAIPDGDLNSDGVVSVVDILIANQILNGQLTITPLQLAHGDVAPLINGIPAPDGLFNVADVLIITQKLANISSF